MHLFSLKIYFNEITCYPYVCNDKRSTTTSCYIVNKKTLVRPLDKYIKKFNCRMPCIEIVVMHTVSFLQLPRAVPLCKLFFPLLFLLFAVFFFLLLFWGKSTSHHISRQILWYTGHQQQPLQDDMNSHKMTKGEPWGPRHHPGKRIVNLQSMECSFHLNLGSPYHSFFELGGT